MAHKIPSFGVVATTFRHIDPRFAHNFTPQSGSPTPRVRFSHINVLDPTTKLEFERSILNPNFFHIRSCFLNKYWSFFNASIEDVMLVSDQKNEDTSHFSCTLFELIFEKQQKIYFIRSVFRRRILFSSLNEGFFRASNNTADIPPTPDPIGISTEGSRFRLIEWDTFVKLPKYVTFRGHNNKFLKVTPHSGRHYISVSADESNNHETAFEVIEKGDGQVELRSLLNDRHMCNEKDWIITSLPQLGAKSPTLFWPVKVGGNVIALRSISNERFCRRLTQGTLVDFLNASGTAINLDARLTVGEPVNARRVYDVRYHMDNARIYGQRAVVAGTGRATNGGREEAMLSVDISIEDRSSYTFTNSASLTTGVSTTITAGVGRIVSLSVGVEVSSEQTISVEIGQEVSRSITSGTSYTVPVPPMSTVVVDYVATEGKCDIPFSYTQRDQNSIDGTFHYTSSEDGVYTGVNYFNFNYTQPRVIRSLQEEENVE